MKLAWLYFIVRLGRIVIKKILTPFLLLKYRKIAHIQREESEQRKKICLFDYKSLAKPMSYAGRHITKGMNLYGFFQTYTIYAGIKRINACYGIEHGLYLAAKGKKYSHEITFSDYREHALKKAYSKAIKIGPYIHYADNLLVDADFAQLKQQLGKVLLVFPTHSLDSVSVKYNMASFVDFIEQHKNSFNTVMICLHYKDIELGKEKFYEEFGYKIVTAGHLYDGYFLSRLKTIITLSDVIISNDVGTHLGYCIYLKKPVCLFAQKTELEIGSSEKEYRKEIDNRTLEEWKELWRIKEHLFHLFSTFEEKITSAQYNEISSLFGFDYIRDSETLKKMLK